MNRHRWGDALAVVLLLTGTVLYLSRFPHSLNPFDESVHLYDAKRLLAGAVMYRDVFNFITPGWMYLMALLFRLFGTDIAVARLATAVIHACTMVSIYATCRSLRVRRGLSWPPALAYLVLCQPVWPVASQHWLSTLLAAVVLWLCVLHLRDRARWSAVLGVVLGSFVGVQQQRAAGIVAGVVLWLLLDHLLDRRYGGGRTIRSLVAALAWLGVGIGTVVVPLFAWLVARAGLAPIWYALVIFPLVEYGGSSGGGAAAWGHIDLTTRGLATFTYPVLLKYLPLVMIPAFLRLGWAAAHRQERADAEQQLLLVVIGVTSIVSILYFPDFIHVAFIAPVFLVMLADTAEWAVRRVPLPQLVLRVAAALAGTALLVACAVRLNTNLVRMRGAHPFSRSSAFGRVDFNEEREARLFDQLQELLRRTPSRYLYCYPLIAHLYLMLDVDNPTGANAVRTTPHGISVPGLSTDPVQDVLDALTATRPPYIVYLPHFGMPGDRVSAWISEHYEPVDANPPPGWQIYRRKSA